MSWIIYLTDWQIFQENLVIYVWKGRPVLWPLQACHYNNSWPQNRSSTFTYTCTNFALWTKTQQKKIITLHTHIAKKKKCQLKRCCSYFLQNPGVQWMMGRENQKKKKTQNVSEFYVKKIIPCHFLASRSKTLSQATTSQKTTSADSHFKFGMYM